MCDSEEKYFGKSVEITGEVQYVGEGSDPKDDPAFKIWEQTLRVLNEKKSNIVPQNKNLALDVINAT